MLEIFILSPIVAIVYCLFGIIIKSLVELNFEKSIEKRVYLNDGCYIDLTDEEYDRIKAKLNKEGESI